jgi:small subunit ribosomal protein S13
MTKFKISLKKEISFTEFGINKKKIFGLCSKIGVNTRRMPVQLKLNLVSKVKLSLKSTLSGKKLKRNVLKSILFCIKVKTYRGIRNKLKYPSRGQRTHTNARTKKKISVNRIGA